MLLCSGKRSGLSTAVAAVVIVIVLAAAGVGVVSATTRATTQTVNQTVTQTVSQTVTQSATVTTQPATQTVTQSATVTTTVTSLQTPTASNNNYNNTLDLRTYVVITGGKSSVAFTVVAGDTGDPIFLIGPLVNPIIKVKTGTGIHIDFYSEVNHQGVVAHSFVIVNSKPPFPSPLSQSDVTPAFFGASSDDPINPQKDQFTIDFVADKPGTYYYISSVDGDASSLYGMYGLFIVED